MPLGDVLFAVDSHRRAPAKHPLPPNLSRSRHRLRKETVMEPVDVRNPDIRWNRARQKGLVTAAGEPALKRNIPHDDWVVRRELLYRPRTRSRLERLLPSEEAAEQASVMLDRAAKDKAYNRALRRVINNPHLLARLFDRGYAANEASLGGKPRMSENQNQLYRDLRDLARRTIDPNFLRSRRKAPKLWDATFDAGR
jgi:hypothetical protein